MLLVVRIKVYLQGPVDHTWTTEIEANGKGIIVPIFPIQLMIQSCYVIWYSSVFDVIMRTLDTAPTTVRGFWKGVKNHNL